MKGFRNILVVFSRETDDPQALIAALQIAEHHQAAITLLQILPALSQLQLLGKRQTPAEIEQAYLHFYLNKLQKCAEQYSSQALIRCKVVIGTGFLETIRAVLRNQHDLVIKTAEPTHWLQRLFGSTDMHLLRKCPCPLWLLKPDAPTNYQSIIAAVELNRHEPHRDEEQLNQQIVEVAASTATLHQSTLSFLHAWQPQDAGIVLMWCDYPTLAQAEYEQQAFQDQLAALNRFKHQVEVWLEPGGYQYLQPSFDLLKGDPSQVLAEKIRQVAPDLVVMGTVGRSGIAGLLIGNTAETLLEQLDCAVLAIKPKGFICPITLDT